MSQTTLEKSFEDRKIVLFVHQVEPSVTQELWTTSKVTASRCKLVANNDSSTRIITMDDISSTTNTSTSEANTFAILKLVTNRGRRKSVVTREPIVMNEIFVTPKVTAT